MMALYSLATFMRRWAHRAVVAAASGVCAVLLVFCGALGTVLLHFHGSGVTSADCAIVFGAAVYGANRPGPALVRRVGTATALYRKGKVRRLFFTGGRGGEGTGQSEAAVMRTQAVDEGVHPGDIVLEEQSRSTWENLLNTRNLTKDCQNVVGISDAYHLARIELIASQQGWGGLHTLPASGRPPRWQEARSIIRETFGYVYYLLHIYSIIDAERVRDVLRGSQSSVHSR